MRQTQIFSGSSHPILADSICERLGQKPANAELGKFSNGETKIQLHTSIRDQDVFIVQSGGSNINDALIELLIMISACKSGSAKSVTAVVPYFPYSRQSKKKSHRGSITARMVANLMDVAGVNHVITVDLHASQMQGFFHCPVDNLVAEPLLANWIRHHVHEWKKAVVVSKNPGGTKRVTSLADALDLDFGIVMTDRYRPESGANSAGTSVVMENSGILSTDTKIAYEHELPHSSLRHEFNAPTRNDISRIESQIKTNDIEEHKKLSRVSTGSSALRNPYSDSEDDLPEEQSRDVVTGRLVQGHIVEDHVPSPSFSTSHMLNGRHRRGSDDSIVHEHMISSFLSTASSARNAPEHGLGGSGDAIGSSDDEEEHLKNPEYESTVHLVGKVKGRTVLIVDDMIDKSASWIAAAETVVKRGGATKVYCMATHGLFGGDCLREIEECDCIHSVIVTNTFPITPHKAHQSKKLIQLDVAGLLSEAIRRNHHGESIHQLYQHYD